MIAVRKPEIGAPCGLEISVRRHTEDKERLVICEGRPEPPPELIRAAVAVRKALIMRLLRGIAVSLIEEGDEFRDARAERRLARADAEGTGDIRKPPLPAPAPHLSEED